MTTFAKREIAKQEREERFEKLWLEQVPALVRGLTESEYLVFENMFEMLADLREEAYFLRHKEMPTLSYTFDRSVKICAVKKKHRLDKELVLQRFREVLKFAEIPEGRPNRYVFRRKLRVMSCGIFFLMRDPATDDLLAN